MTVTPLEKRIEPRLHLPYLDGLRGVAALFVMFNHAYVTVFNPTHAAPPSIDRILGWLSNGCPSVDVFIVLSGVCLMLPTVRDGYVLKRGVADFFRRRIRRIVPPYLCLLAVTWLIMALTPLGKHVTGAGWNSCVPASGEMLRSAVAHVLLLHDILGRYNTHFGYQLWTIPVEVHIYLLFPLLLVSWRRLGAGTTAAIACIAGFTLSKALMRIPGTYNIAPNLYALFALGAWTATVSFDRKNIWATRYDRIPWEPIAVISTLLIAAVMLLKHQLAVTYIHYFDYLVGAWAVCVIAVASRNPDSVICRIFSARPLTEIGKFSYSLYLLHVLALSLVWQYLVRPFHPGDLGALCLMFGVGAPLTVAASYLFFLAFERPFLNSRRS